VDAVKLELRIETLVLRGLGAGMQHEIRAVMERELAELFRAEGPAPSLHRPRDLSRLDGGTIRVGPTVTGRAIGKQLAQSVYRGIAG
jgi:hypothetical protein